jgi:pantothenate kinase-related protein Tda10
VTHDVALAILNLRDLQKMRDDPIIVSGYHKGAHHGDGDRFRWINVEDGMEVKVQVYSGQLTVSKEVQEVLAMKLVSLHVGEHEIPVTERMGSDVPVVDHLLPGNLIEFLNNHKDQEVTVVADGEDNVKFYGNGEVVVAKKELPNGWRVIKEKPDFIFYDGWMLGAQKVEDESIFDSGLPALETDEDKAFAKMVNKKLMDYEMLWDMMEFTTVLYVVNYEDSLKWRDQAEETLRAKGEGMSHDEIRDFVHYFWRSVHPGIHIKNLAHDGVHAQQVVVINDDHSVGEILTPYEAREKYP